MNSCQADFSSREYDFLIRLYYFKNLIGLNKLKELESIYY